MYYIVIYLDRVFGLNNSILIYLGLIDDKMLVSSTAQATKSSAWSVIDGDYDGLNTCSKEADISNINNYLKIDLFGVYTVKRVSIFQVSSKQQCEMFQAKRLKGAEVNVELLLILFVICRHKLNKVH